MLSHYYLYKSTRKTKSDKPDKPYPEFPLFAHATGRWAKKIRGKLHCFGPWDKPQEALDKYLDQRDDLHAGRTPRSRTDGLSIRDLVHRFLTAKTHLVETGELSKRTLRDYHDVCARLIEHFGKTRLVEDLDPLDFEKLRASIAKTRGPVALGNEVQWVRIIFKYAYDADLSEKSVRFGPTFKRPNRKTLRKTRQANGQRMFEADELGAILDATENPLRAMILLGINCGFGNHDCGTLPKSALDLAGGWVNYPRPKTASERRCPLWPETVKALQATIASRTIPKDAAHAHLVFITKYGKPWAKETPDSPISNEMAKLLKRPRCGACGRIQEDHEVKACKHCKWKPAKGETWPQIYRRGLNFYALRHTFETIAGESKDQVAVDHIMGHARDDMASHYRERISDERLLAVTDVVHRWLFGAPESA